MNKFKFIVVLLVSGLFVQAQSYLPLSGGTLTGTLSFSGATGYKPISILGGVAEHYVSIQDGAGRINWYWNKVGNGTSPTYEVSGEDAIRLKFSTSQAAGNEAGLGIFYAPASTAGLSISWTEILGAFHNRFQYLGNNILHAGNYSSYALPLSGGTLTGALFGTTAVFSSNVGIGTTTPGPYKLAVEGTLGARKIKVTQVNPWADYVFDSSYLLKPLSEVERFIKTNKHLPEMPSANEVAKDGIDVGENQALLLKKIEELTLYMIEMKKENCLLRQRIEKLESKE